MNESEVRARVHAAFGEANYPSAMVDRVTRRLNAPSSRSHPHRYGLVAAGLAVLLIAALVATRLEFPRSVGQASEPPAQARSGPVDPSAKLPPEDLSAARLAGSAADLVTPLNLVAESHGQSLALIAAYADTSEVVLFFRGQPNAATLHAEVYDQASLLNYGASGANGVENDIVYVLGGGAHPGRDGFAHINVVVDNVQPSFDGPPGPGTFSFSFAIKVQPGVALKPVPVPGSTAGWKITVEAFEATPAVVRFQAVFDGVSIQQVGDASIQLVSADGTSVQESMSSTELIGQHFFFWIFGDRPTRETVTWVRPATGDYVLEISAPGIKYRGTVAIA